ncbi:hypothetical protein CEXT_677681 [Caerostris extrusa]|uniref:Uncharacterized protein n=1 Tax=Caerostris extrusa TaxID=172846 RepID=A0AAV4N3K7_CAEEX|nr:hypothetical protein CEXT_677681 [Caerostris extrusa]
MIPSPVNLTAPVNHSPFVRPPPPPQQQKGTKCLQDSKFWSLLFVFDGHPRDALYLMLLSANITDELGPDWLELWPLEPQA